jgi:multiple RNA-binding domain-containing protein 1
MSKVHVDFARTLDDPNLPRPWSKHTQGSTAYDQKNKTNKSWELI